MRLAISIVVLVIAAVGAPAAAQPSVQVRTLRGGLDPQDVSDIVHTDETIDRCFAAASDKDRRGVDATATVKIDRAGAVTRVKLAKVPRRMKKCVTAAMRGLTFPASTVVSTLTVSITTDADADAVALQEEDAAAMAALALIGSDESIPQADMSRSPSGDLNAQIDLARGVDPGTSTGGGKARTASGLTSGTPSGRISITHKSGSGPLAADKVLAKIQSTYFAGLKRCYKTELASDPTLKGTLALVIEIGADGKTTAFTATGVTATCAEGLGKAWRFPARDESSRIELELQLVPD